MPHILQSAYSVGITDVMVGVMARKPQLIPLAGYNNVLRPARVAYIPAPLRLISSPCYCFVNVLNWESHAAVGAYAHDPLWS